MKITTRGRINQQDEELERRRASTQRNVYYLKIEQEEGEGRPQQDRIEIELDGTVYRIEFDGAGLIVGGYGLNGLPVDRLFAEPKAENIVLIGKA